MVFPLHVLYSLGIIGIFFQTWEYLSWISQRANDFVWIVVTQQCWSESSFGIKKRDLFLCQMSYCSYLLELLCLEALHLLGLCQGISQHLLPEEECGRKRKHCCIYCYCHTLLLFQFWFVPKPSQITGNFLITCWNVVTLLSLKKLEEVAFEV